MRLSARNVLKGKVVKVTPGAVNSEIILELTGGAQVDYGEPSVLRANIHAMLDTVKEYGVYKK